jgi:hypothetical protein
MTRRISRRHLLRGSAIASGALAAGIGVPRSLQAADGAWGDLVGRLVYDGTGPARKKLKVDKDVDCCGKFDIRDESLMVGPEGGLANVFVYARTRKIPVCPELRQALPKRVKLDNRDCIFKPHCMSIWHSQQEFYILNSDPIAQNVDFRPLGDLPANIILSPAPGSNVDVTWKFNKMQLVPVPIACNYHPWESAYILPRDNPYVAISALDGTFRIPKLPVGKIEFQVWQERAGYVETPAWPRGRFEWDIRPGVNDLGTIKLLPAMFEKK